MDEDRSRQGVLEVKNLTFAYEDKIVLDDIDFQVLQGDFLGIIGPNGSGKTTLLKSILGLLKPQRGQVEWFEVPVSAFHDWNRIGYISQKAANFNAGFPATVYEVVSMGLTGKKGMFSWITGDDRAKILQMLALVGMEGWENQLIGKLSGGQQQRVLIAKAMVAEPDVMVFDEPTVGVDCNSVEIFYQLLETLHRDYGKTILLVSHDMDAVLHRVNQILCIKHKVFYYGSKHGFLQQQDEIMGAMYRNAVPLSAGGQSC